MASDPLANSGHFFGMTTLGATDPFFDAAATTIHYPFHDIDESAYEQAFEAQLLSNTSRGKAVAETLQVDADSSVLRSKLGEMLNTVLGRQAHRAELAAWFSFLDFDRGAIMTRTEFSTAIQQLRSWSAAPERARQYSSFARMAADKKQHRRVEWSAQKALQEPVTAAQTVGWHAAKPHHEAPEERFTLPHTDVTCKEGRTHATYYGYMTLL